jgi:hypothetical protein
MDLLFRVCGRFRRRCQESSVLLWRGTKESFRRVLGTVSRIFRPDFPQYSNFRVSQICIFCNKPSFCEQSKYLSWERLLHQLFCVDSGRGEGEEKSHGSRAHADKGNIEAVKIFIVTLGHAECQEIMNLNAEYIRNLIHVGTN